MGAAAGAGEATGGGGVVALGEVPFEHVLAYDRWMFSASRPAFLRCWIDRPGHTALGFMENGALGGYTVFPEMDLPLENWFGVTSFELG
jgi:hypothetical protein